ncbi:hypothetical protein QUF72_14625, partial [Desulfobacterales bacterium HSG2]|nr:hypothetical protein [Desulfobacterales bacterium HSG2]
RGDHFIYEFEGARSWPLTLRDPVPISHLKQLVSITGYPMNVIKTALIHEKERFRISNRCVQ